jgi:hypothetical protein
MNSNKFAALSNYSDSEQESVNSDSTEFEQSIQIAQVSEHEAHEGQVEEQLYSPLTADNLAALNSGFAHVQVCEPEPEVIIRAKTKLLNTLVFELKKKVQNGFCQVYRSCSIFALLREHPMYSFIREVADGSEESYQGNGLKLFQYRYFDTMINIIVSYSWGSCSYCDSDIALEESLYGATKKVIWESLEEDLRAKFNCLKFFLDFKEASSYVNKNAKRRGFTVKFIENPKKTEERRLKKEEEREQRRRYGNQPFPKSLTFGDFIPKELNLG